MTTHKFKYDLLSYDLPKGHPQGESHPQRVIRRLYPKATHLTPESLFDCWTFRLDYVPSDLPPYIKEMSAEWLPEEQPDDA